MASRLAAEYIVVGGGSAGCTAAARLAQAGRKVLLLEAGGSGKSPFVTMPVGAETNPQVYQPSHVAVFFVALDHARPHGRKRHPRL